MPTGVGRYWSDAVDELTERGFQGLAGSPRLDGFLQEGVERALAALPAWPFLLKTYTNYVPGTAVSDLAAAQAVDTLGGLPLEHRSRQWLRANGYDVNRVGAARAWYVGATALGQPCIKTCFVDTTPVNLDYFAAPQESSWDLIPNDFWSLIMDCAVRAASKDANDWETVAGLGEEIRNRQAELIEKYYDQQTGNAEYVAADVED